MSAASLGQEGESPLEERTWPPLLGLGLWAEDSADGLVEDVLEALLGEGRALEVLDGPYFLGHGQPLWVGDRGQLALPQFLHRVFVLAQVELGAHKNDGRIRAVVAYLRVPLGPDVLERCWVHQGETDEEDVL